MASPNGTAGSAEEEEVLFIEDRRPGNVPPIKLKPTKDTTKVSAVQDSLDFIQFNNFGAKSTETNVKLDEADNSKTEEPAFSTAATEQANEEMMLFMEDRNPQLTGQEISSPRYRINENFLKMHGNESSSRKNKLSNTCWNCGQTTHALRDCKEPKNHGQIAKSRREFLGSKGSTPSYKRYHVDENQSFGHKVPGQLSAELRSALGLKDDELPCHIYKMRQLGYPPGWLLEAKVSHSGISMYDGQGKEVADPTSEVGEVVENGSLDKYDIRKILRYPGFNVPPPPGTHDDSQYYQCPPMSRSQSFEVMLEKLGERLVGGYKRKKLSFAATSSQFDDSSQSVDTQDMEYEETPEGVELPADNCKFVPPLPDEELPPPPPTELPDEPPETDISSLSTLSNSIEETSLVELEEQKKQLLAQLNTPSQGSDTPESKVGKVKSVDLGTPILKSVSPFARLPSAEKFSVNICDVINFENLPDSTGKYEKMSGIIRKVRCKLAKINNEP